MNTCKLTSSVRMGAPLPSCRGERRGGVEGQSTQNTTHYYSSSENVHMLSNNDLFEVVYRVVSLLLPIQTWCCESERDSLWRAENGTGGGEGGRG